VCGVAEWIVKKEVKDAELRWRKPRNTGRKQDEMGKGERRKSDRQNRAERENGKTARKAKSEAGTAGTMGAIGCHSIYPIRGT
jgi:hypothetical protein